ncbi:hypothetical protein E2C01_078791 [Portunus trituberculatus]|uniref:Uncharacterized protein n=1 Tax=Portunus trituberculatus TaxID=210409 RepID=A0A5B7INN6_PORTR|nr:hypothetical protein [Portunus trituberculatus]
MACTRASGGRRCEERLPLGRSSRPPSPCPVPLSPGSSPVVVLVVLVVVRCLDRRLLSISTMILALVSRGNSDRYWSPAGGSGGGDGGGKRSAF